MDLFKAVDQFKKFVPLFLEEVHGDIVEFQVIGGLAIRFFGFPGQVALGLGQGFGLGFRYQSWAY